LFSVAEVLLDIEVVVSSVFVSEVTSSFFSSDFLSSFFLALLLPVTLVSGFLFWLFVCVTFGLFVISDFLLNQIDDILHHNFPL